jgi:CRP-like cAMP-binding protein
MTIEDDIAFFEQVPTLGVLGRQALRILAIGAESRYLHAGDTLFTAGEPADCAYVVQEGSFSLTPKSEAGGSGMRLPAGSLLGELALVIDTKRLGHAVALEPSTVVRISRSLFLKMLEGYPEAALRLRDHLAQRAEESTRELVSVRSVLGVAGEE